MSKLDNISDLQSEYDVVIIGAGPAGSALAINLCQKDYNVLILEKANFPRFHIGESLSGECAALLNEMGLGEEIEAAGFLVKHSLLVQGQSERSKFRIPVQKINADKTISKSTTWQVRRSEFDQILLDKAQSLGASRLQADALNVTKDNGVVTGISLKGPGGEKLQVRSKMVADASGQSCFLGNRNVLGKRQRAGYEKQIAIFAHVKGCRRDAAPHTNDTVIFYGETDHWSWLIPIDDEITSIGIVVPNEKFKTSGLSLTDFFKTAYNSINPHLAKWMENAEIVSDVRATANYSYEFENVVGPGFICIGDSHSFLDPIFSFGVNVALHEGKMAAAEIQRYFENGTDHSFAAYRDDIKSSHGTVRLLVDTFWKYPLAFLRLAHYSHKTDLAELFSGRLLDKSALSLEAVKLMQGLFEQDKHAR